MTVSYFLIYFDGILLLTSTFLFQQTICTLTTTTNNSDVWNSTPNIHASGPPILSESSTALTDASRILHHRGPDGMLTSRGVYGPQRWAMGHTRLAIVDPSNRQADMYV